MVSNTSKIRSDLAAANRCDGAVNIDVNVFVNEASAAVCHREVASTNMLARKRVVVGPVTDIEWPLEKCIERNGAGRGCGSAA